MLFDKRPYRTALGDCIEVLKELPENFVDSLVTDPPYGWRFMGKAWDGADIEKMFIRDAGKNERKLYSDGKFRNRRIRPAQAAGKYDLSNDANVAFQVWTESWAREVYRVLKPGAHALIFCGPRTYHRMASGVEDAGFEVRDQLQWLFGSGFPKSLDISKAIDKAAGAENIVGKYDLPDVADGRRSKSWECTNTTDAGMFGATGQALITAPSTDAAKKWEGFGTALKPANEPILLARKPLSEKTVAQNVLKWGTGGLNIGASRIAGAISQVPNPVFNSPTGKIYNMKTGEGRNGKISRAEGRFPSNLLLDEEAAKMLDVQSGSNMHSAGSVRGRGKAKQTNDGALFGVGNHDGNGMRFGDTGGASRFFYVAKTSRWERNAGLDRSPEITDDGRKKPIDNPYLRGKTKRMNGHPTVKPIPSWDPERPALSPLRAVFGSSVSNGKRSIWISPVLELKTSSSKPLEIRQI